MAVRATVRALLIFLFIRCRRFYYAFELVFLARRQKNIVALDELVGIPPISIGSKADSQNDHPWCRILLLGKSSVVLRLDYWDFLPFKLLSCPFPNVFVPQCSNHSNRMRLPTLPMGIGNVLYYSPITLKDHHQCWNFMHHSMMVTVALGNMTIRRCWVSFGPFLIVLNCVIILQPARTHLIDEITPHKTIPG